MTKYTEEQSTMKLTNVTLGTQMCLEVVQIYGKVLVECTVQCESSYPKSVEMPVGQTM